MTEEIKNSELEEELVAEETQQTTNDTKQAGSQETVTEESVKEEAGESNDETTGETAEDEKSEAADSENEKADGEPAKKEGFFKKKKDKKDEQIEELQDKLKRQMAEFENFRKRSEKEKSQMFDLGAKTIIEKVLPVVDNFERGLAAVPEEQREDAFVTGMDKVYKQFMTELEATGVKAIEAVGKEFDPELHNAVMQVEDESLESGIVAQELQKGYTYKDTVVRHSMVAVNS